MSSVRRIIAVFVLLLLVIVPGTAAWLLGSLPVSSGAFRVAGLKGPVNITRDHNGVPHILANNDEDAYFALGFAQAQDRLWQMEEQRRIGAGRLSEVLGPGALPVDRFMRTMGLYQLAQDDFAALDQRSQGIVTAYVAGINAFLARHPNPLPPEFLLLRTRPEPWAPADVLVWARVLAFQLSTNWRDELLKTQLLKTLPAATVNDLWPGYPASQPTTLGLAGDTAEKMLASIPRLFREGGASNAWAVSGAHTVSGKPLLANDPHLGFAAPILWYLATLDGPGLHVAGATIPGLPAVLLGHNSRIAWGSTTTTSDTEDLFIEHAQGDSYETPDGLKPFTHRQETIHVKGMLDIALDVRETRHGPVVSDLIGDQAGGQILALAGTFLQPRNRTTEAFLDFDHADDWDSFTHALANFQMPQQNMIYADAGGHIGFAVAGLTPIRKSGDGTAPEPGWDGDHDWTGWIPDSALPRTLDPASGIIVNANNKVAPDSYPYFLAATWPEGYRAQRITQMLAAKRKLAPSDMAAMQMDETSLMALDLKPLLLRAPATSARAIAAHAMLLQWDGTVSRERPEPLIVETWLGQLQADLVRDKLGAPANAQMPGLRPLFLKKVLSAPSNWCGVIPDAPPSACDAKVSAALDEAIALLTTHFGDDMSLWRWGDAHIAEFDALLFDHIPGLDRLTRLTARTGGDEFTVQRGASGVPDPDLFLHRGGAGLRAVYDLSALDDSRFVIATGESGNPVSTHWADLFKSWQAGMNFSLAPEGNTGQILNLSPLG